ncbi:hypothetical protein, partial [Streptomyces gilvosporeus]|uniref:hypothetical protein n=1 Tax=Streptomyces gilvosporeus TaxID=553510 RepID=UPI0033C49198
MDVRAVQPFQSGDGSGNGFADAPGRRDSCIVVLAFEGEAVDLPAVRDLIFVALDGEAASAEVLDYWREGVIPTVHYSPISLAPTDDTEYVTPGAL